MGTIVVKLVDEALAHPDLDIRYALPDLLVERSGGALQDDGYDYASDGAALLIFLRGDRPEETVAAVIDFIENVPVLVNDLRSAATVSIEDAGRSKLVYARES